MTELKGHRLRFAWALYDEVLPHQHGGDFLIAREQLYRSNFARARLLNRGQVEQEIEVLRRHHLLAARDKLLRLVAPQPEYSA